MTPNSPLKTAEITFKAVIIAIIIALVLAASNVYLALKVGTTIAASIPAAVLAMGILKFFRRSSALEINIIQTVASAGEGMAAAVSFVLPALIILGYWHSFHYWETVWLAGLGGVLGVLFSIPLRRIMLNYPALRFPEGTAIGNILKVGTGAKSYTRELVQGSIAGGVIALAQGGLQVLTDTVPMWFVSRGKLLYGMSFGFSPALVAAGYIIGIESNIAMLLGVVLIWLLGMPVLSHLYGLPVADSNYDMAMTIWSQHIRYIGVGTMLVGGVWTLLTLIKPVVQGVILSFKSVSKMTEQRQQRTTVNERDIPMHYVVWGVIALVAISFFAFIHILHQLNPNFLPQTLYSISLFAAVYILVAGFIIACICAYFAGLIGSTNNPLSGMLIISVLLCSLLLLPIFFLLGGSDKQLTKASLVIIVIIITAMIAAIASIANENLQDLKAGQMIGATPWKQQLMLLLGVAVSALVVAPVLELLFNAYGMGGVFPRLGMDKSQMLSVPQAGLIATIAKGFFDYSLAWGEIATGAIIAVFGIILDEMAKKRGHRLPVLAIGLGIYLPPEVILPMVFGGLIHFLSKRRLLQKQVTVQQTNSTNEVDGLQRGLLLCCGIVAGAALMGVGLAIPFVIKGNSDVLALVSAHFAPIAALLSFIVTIGLGAWMYRVSCSNK